MKVYVALYNNTYDRNCTVIGCYTNEEEAELSFYKYFIEDQNNYTLSELEDEYKRIDKNYGKYFYVEEFEVK